MVSLARIMVGPSAKALAIHRTRTSPTRSFFYQNTGVDCAITGGTFYNPQTVQFPSTFVGKYFFSDFCGGWIHTIDSLNPSVATEFATGISNPVDLKVSPDGFLYYLARGAGTVNRISFTGGG